MKKKPCPFCGGCNIKLSTRIVQEGFDSPDRYNSRLKCLNCQSIGPLISFELPCEANCIEVDEETHKRECELVEKWNKRV